VVNFWKKEPRCGQPQPSGHITYVIPNTDVEAQLMTSFSAFLHVESGSGLGDMGKVAFVDCEYSFVLGDIPN